MNQAILDFFNKNLCESDIKSKAIIELGARNINGSVRPDIEVKQPGSYTGVDMAPGRCVDTVCDILDIFTKFEPEKFDIVIATELLGNVVDFPQAINALKRLAKPGALIMISARSKGAGYSGFPFDFWRYEIEDIQNLFADCETLALTPDGQNGIILKARKKNVEPLDISNYELYNIIFDKRVRYDPILIEGFIAATALVDKKDNYFAAYNNLLAFGYASGTDKVAHGYLRKYEFFLSKFREEEFNFLELGVFNGASLKMWAQYFQCAQIYGCDIDPTCYRFNGGRISISILDLGQIASYRRLTARPYKIILDDASHYLDQQLLAFFYLFPCLESGGIYILEDLHTNFQPLLPKFIHGSNDTAANVLLNLAELTLGQNAAPNVMNGYHDILKSFAPQIDCISFIAKSCIIVKK